MDGLHQFIGKCMFVGFMLTAGIVWVCKQFAASSPEEAEAAKNVIESKAIAIINRLLK